MPFGDVLIDEALAHQVLKKGAGLIRADSQAHAMEHSIEVQVPFLQILRPDVSIVPISVGRVVLDDCEKIGKALAGAIQTYDDDVLLVASTDMTHYESQESARSKDQMAIDRILELDPRGLYDVVSRERISMCGVIATTMVLFAALELGAKKAELIRYATSGDVTGDHDQVVGYAGLIVY
jgi:AmmeMemoRadiSam system protein B